MVVGIVSIQVDGLQSGESDAMEGSHQTQLIYRPENMRDIIGET